MIKLQELGLKWIVKFVTWDTMCDALCRYAQAKRDRDKNGNWDGTVPSTYETDDEPALQLGSWIRMKRLAYKENRLEKD